MTTGKLNIPDDKEENSMSLLNLKNLDEQGITPYLVKNSTTNRIADLNSDTDSHEWLQLTKTQLRATVYMTPWPPPWRLPTAHCATHELAWNQHSLQTLTYNREQTRNVNHE